MPYVSKKTEKKTESMLLAVRIRERRQLTKKLKLITALQMQQAASVDDTDQQEVHNSLNTSSADPPDEQEALKGECWEESDSYCSMFIKEEEEDTKDPLHFTSDPTELPCKTSNSSQIADTYIDSDSYLDSVIEVKDDFAKAFDRCDHGVIAHKMRAKGITGKVARWIFNFVTNRTQSVIVTTIKSGSSTVKSSVSQDTVLDPVLYLILISDIDKDTN
ncbi:uncharacterized protein [Procambarus clarkii]|uniref:uncharacterized protein n=1 Tax=Procambarus clarkii TaxID=6728 RepID=UPI0037443164